MTGSEAKPRRGGHFQPRTEWQKRVKRDESCGYGKPMKPATYERFMNSPTRVDATNTKSKHIAEPLHRALAVE